MRRTLSKPLMMFSKHVGDVTVPVYYAAGRARYGLRNTNTPQTGWVKRKGIRAETFLGY